jgi:hypothetical protein
MHDRALAAAAAPHDNENLAPVDRESEMLLDHVAAVSQSEIFYGNMRIVIRHSFFLFLSEYLFPCLIYHSLSQFSDTRMG